jgi:hypothetical protein
LLWTPLPIESVMEGWGATQPRLHLTTLHDGTGSQVLIDSASGEDRIFRLLSTNPQDYLCPELAPGEPWFWHGRSRA